MTKIDVWTQWSCGGCGCYAPLTARPSGSTRRRQRQPTFPSPSRYLRSRFLATRYPLYPVRNMDFRPRLACEQCARRKIRCDKRSPCSACTGAQLTCNAVRRARLPRGRTGKTLKKDVLLEARIARIEEIVSKQQIEASGSQALEDANPRRDLTRSGNRIGDFVAPGFWSSLCEEVTLTFPSHDPTSHLTHCDVGPRAA